MILFKEVQIKHFTALTIIIKWKLGVKLHGAQATDLVPHLVQTNLNWNNAFSQYCYGVSGFALTIKFRNLIIIQDAFGQNCDVVLNKKWTISFFRETKIFWSVFHMYYVIRGTSKQSNRDLLCETVTCVSYMYKAL